MFLCIYTKLQKENAFCKIEGKFWRPFRETLCGIIRWLRFPADLAQLKAEWLFPNHKEMPYMDI